MWPGQGGPDFLEELTSVGVGRVVVPMMGAAEPTEHLQNIAEIAIP